MRALKGVDVRTVGSGNIGGTNVWRSFGWRYGLTVILVDFAKGFGPALVGSLVVDDLAGVLAGSAAMAGHYRPIFLRFGKGGKMVATAGGVFFALAPFVALIGLGVWIAMFLLSRYASVASIVTAVSMPVTSALLGESWPVIIFAAVAAVGVIGLHRQNLRRLRAGTESRFDLRRRSRSPVRSAADPSSGRAP